MQAEVAQRDQVIQQLHLEIDEVRQSLESLNQVSLKEKKDLHRQIGQFSSQISQLKASNSELENKHCQLESSLKQADQELGTRDKYVSDLEAENIMLRNEIK